MCRKLNLHITRFCRYFLEAPIRDELQQIRNGVWAFAGHEGDEPLMAALVQQCGAKQLQLLCRGGRAFADEHVMFAAANGTSNTSAQRALTHRYVQYCQRFYLQASPEERRLLVEFATAIRGAHPLASTICCPPLAVTAHWHSSVMCIVPNSQLSARVHVCSCMLLGVRASYLCTKPFEHPCAASAVPPALPSEPIIIQVAMQHEATERNRCPLAAACSKAIKPFICSSEAEFVKLLRAAINCGGGAFHLL